MLDKQAIKEQMEIYLEHTLHKIGRASCRKRV